MSHQMAQCGIDNSNPDDSVQILIPYNICFVNGDVAAAKHCTQH